MAACSPPSVAVSAEDGAGDGGGGGGGGWVIDESVDAGEEEEDDEDGDEDVSAAAAIASDRGRQGVVEVVGGDGEESSAGSAGDMLLGTDLYDYGEHAAALAVDLEAESAGGSAAVPPASASESMAAEGDEVEEVASGVGVDGQGATAPFLAMPDRMAKLAATLAAEEEGGADSAGYGEAELSAGYGETDMGEGYGEMLVPEGQVSV